MPSLFSSGCRSQGLRAVPHTACTSQGTSQNQEAAASGSSLVGSAGASQIGYTIPRLGILPNEIRNMILRYVVANTAGDQEPPANAVALIGLFEPFVSTSIIYRDVSLELNATTNASACHSGLFVPGSPSPGDNFLYKPSPCHWSTCGSTINIFYRPIPRPKSVVSLLSLDKRTREETLHIISESQSRADLIYIKDSGFWLTWLSTPFQTRRIPELHIQVRAYEFPILNQFPAICDEDTWSTLAGPGCRMFYLLMTGILQGTVGPWLFDSTGEEYAPHDEHC